MTASVEITTQHMHGEACLFLLPQRNLLLIAKHQLDNCCVQFVEYESKEAAQRTGFYTVGTVLCDCEQVHEIHSELQQCFSLLSYQTSTW